MNLEVFTGLNSATVKPSQDLRCSQLTPPTSRANFLEDLDQDELVSYFRI